MTQVLSLSIKQFQELWKQKPVSNAGPFSGHHEPFEELGSFTCASTRINGVYISGAKVLLAK